MERIDWTTKYCMDCGCRLDRFGCCPYALAKDCAIMTAPVSCGSVQDFRVSLRDEIFESVQALLIKNFISPFVTR